MDGDRLIVNLAPTGMVPSKADNPALPVTPDEVAEDCRVCAAAGASIFHLHARDESGRPTWRGDIYRQIAVRVRRVCPEAVICVSTSGRLWPAAEQRMQVLDLDGEAKPDMASLTLGSLNFPTQASVNAPEMIRELAEGMHERGIVPELEVFDAGMLDYAKYLIGRGVLREPYYFNLLLGSLGTLAATPMHLCALVAELPAGAIWAAAGIGRFQFPMNALAIAMGGGVRVGLEDNLHMDAGKQRPATNLALVERLARIAQACERALASPGDVRRMLGLPSRAR